MPTSYRVDSDRKVVFATFDGDLTDEEFLQHADDIANDPEITGSFVELISSDATSMDGVSAAGLRSIAEAIKATPTITKIAIVASESVEFGLARMVGLLADDSPTEVHVFREHADARKWLGLE